MIAAAISTPKFFMQLGEDIKITGELSSSAATTIALASSKVKKLKAGTAKSLLNAGATASFNVINDIVEPFLIE
jgi:hypothetical protein